MLCLMCGAFSLGGIAEERMCVNDFIIIAHRGVVTDTIPENSLASLEETIRRGYTHIEVDLRCTKDGHAVCLHDDNLRRAADRTQRVSDLTLAELRAQVSVDLVPDFATFCARCQGRIGLMPDIKAGPPGAEEAYARSIEAAMVKHDLMANAFFIGTHSITRHFTERVKVSRSPSRAEAQARERAPDQPGESYFIFGHAVDFDAASVKSFQALGFQVIVSINIFHYLRTGGWQANGDRDVARMLAYGVDGLQMDSVYEPAFRESYEANTVPAAKDGR